MLRLIGAALALGIAAPAMAAEPFFVGEWVSPSKRCKRIADHIPHDPPILFTTDRYVTSGHDWCDIHETDIDDGIAVLQVTCTEGEEGIISDESIMLERLSPTTMLMTSADYPDYSLYLSRCSP